MIDQNIIILVLILIAILVAFYSTYLSIDNSRKIKRLQNDIRDTLGNINSTLHLNNNLVDEPKPEQALPSKTELEELDKFPSLDEIEQFHPDNMSPLDAGLKKELDDILENNNDATEEAIEEAHEEVEEAHEEVEEAHEEAIEEAHEEVEEAHEEVEEAHEEVEKAIEEETKEVFMSFFEETTEEAHEEVVETLDSVDLSEQIEELQIPDSTDTELFTKDTMTNLLSANSDVNTDVDLESVISNVEEKSNDLPELKDLNAEVLNKMHDKFVKLICKREKLKVRGTKVERIARILEAQEFKININ